MLEYTLIFSLAHRPSEDIIHSTHTLHLQIQSYARGVLVRAVDPFTRGALRERMVLLGSTVNLRSFFDAPTPRGHTIKGSGLVAFRANKRNTQAIPMCFALQRACEQHMRSIGVQGSDYNFGPVQAMDTTAIVSINGRRYHATSLFGICVGICMLLPVHLFKHVPSWPHRWRTDSMCDYYAATRSGPGTTTSFLLALFRKGL